MQQWPSVRFKTPRPLGRPNVQLLDIAAMQGSQKLHHNFSEILLHSRVTLGCKNHKNSNILVELTFRAADPV